MKPIYFHIGIQRTGTTFLQREVFFKIEELNVLDFKKKGTKAERDPLLFTFLKDIPKDIGRLKKTILERINPEKVNLVSNENIYCDMFSKEDDRFERIKELKKLFPCARIIIGIRRKDELLYSWYNKYVQEGGVYELEEFKKKVINPNKLNYDPYIKLLFELFGRENVCIYRHEDIKKDVNLAVQKICDFLGVKVPNFQNRKLRTSYSTFQLKVAISINKIFKTELNPSGLIPLKKSWHLPHRVILRLFQT